MADPVTGSLVGKRWFLVRMKHDGRDYALPSSSRPFLEFEADGKLTGFGGCNRMLASYRVGADGSLEIGPIGSTRMYCEDTMDLEDKFFQSLSKSRSIDVAQEKLIASSPDRSTVLEFEAES